MFITQMNYVKYNFNYHFNFINKNLLIYLNKQYLFVSNYQ